MKKLPLNYVAGLIDADGSMSISLSNRGYKKNALTIGVAINLRQMSQYRWILEAVQETMGGGKIYNHADGMSSWQSTRHQEAVDIARKIYPYLRIKKETCRKFIDVMVKWNGKEFNKHTARSKHQLTRPMWLIEEILETALTLNQCRQTKTARKNKKVKIDGIRNQIKKFYKV